MFGGMIQLIMLTVLGSGSTELPNYVDSPTYWKAKGIEITLANMAT